MTKLSGNALKMIATLSMLIDHLGYFLFPDLVILRIVGRISFPIFAFMIAEGCRYTKSRTRYFLTIFTLAVLMQSVFFIYTGGTYKNIFFTLSLGILLIYSLPKNINSKKEILRFIFSVVAVYIITLFLKPDYGFMGCELPLFAAIFPDNHKKRLAVFSVGLLLLFAVYKGIYIFSLLAIPLLYFYSGERGRRNLKYFFYAFYPLHLIVLFILKEAVTK